MKRIISGILPVLLLIVGLSACGGEQAAVLPGVSADGDTDEELVWVMKELDKPKDLMAYYEGVIQEGDICYFLDDISQHFIRWNAVTGEERQLELKWPETYAEDKKLDRKFTLDSQGNLYMVFDIRQPQQRSERGAYYLVKFDAEGNFVYGHDIRAYVKEGTAGERSISYEIEVDSEGHVYLAFNSWLMLFDENGIRKESIRVSAEDSQLVEGIYDIARNRDGKVYVLYHSDWGTRMSQVDYESATLINPQTDISGDKFAFAPKDGFVVSNGTELYSYSTDMPTVEQVTEVEFVWWDYLINGENLSELSVTEDGSIIAIIFSSKEEFCHMVVAEQMTEQEAADAAKRDESIKLKRQ